MILRISWARSLVLLENLPSEGNSCTFLRRYYRAIYIFPNSLDVSYYCDIYIIYLHLFQHFYRKFVSSSNKIKRPECLLDITCPLQAGKL